MLRFPRIIQAVSQKLRSGIILDVQTTTATTWIQAASYKSHLSIDKVYPHSDADFLRQKDSKESQGNADQFSGYIPVDQLKITTSKSSGPGGQNVNKVNSKVEIRFHVDSASWIPDWVKARLTEQEQGRITKDGYFVVRSDATRKQMLNQADCMDKLRTFVFRAATLPKEPSADDLKVKEERLSKAKAGVLREKRERSLIKRNRSAPDM
ncbi:peptidyl-tRNA hydrolase ICT1, mitochondrial [Aplysia californica]|uniref:Large ribosomal subunit protein mL62 n=1 Tax=Aplysia californica TaxID=6500 RepID=A0ABM0JTR6_APLCA|nr:peptidyl-tRNA hydrolase ICT1, mitochondrial [Aplysia californica]